MANKNEKTSTPSKKELTPEQIKARREAYFSTHVRVMFHKDEAKKFGIQVSPKDTPDEIAKKIKAKFGIVAATRTSGADYSEMESALKAAGFKLPNKEECFKVNEDGKKVSTYGNKLRQLVTKMAIAQIKRG